jgi:hypothetical protein
MERHKALPSRFWQKAHREKAQSMAILHLNTQWGYTDKTGANRALEPRKSNSIREVHEGFTLSFFTRATAKNVRGKKRHPQTSIALLRREFGTERKCFKNTNKSLASMYKNLY